METEVNLMVLDDKRDGKSLLKTEKTSCRRIQGMHIYFSKWGSSEVAQIYKVRKSIKEKETRLFQKAVLYLFC